MSDPLLRTVRITSRRTGRSNDAGLRPSASRRTHPSAEQRAPDVAAQRNPSDRTHRGRQVAYISDVVGAKHDDVADEPGLDVVGHQEMERHTLEHDLLLVNGPFPGPQSSLD